VPRADSGRFATRVARYGTGETVVLRIVRPLLALHRRIGPNPAPPGSPPTRTPPVVGPGLYAEDTGDQSPPPRALSGSFPPMSDHQREP